MHCSGNYARDIKGTYGEKNYFVVELNAPVVDTFVHIA